MPGLSAVFSGRRGRLLKTGQTTQYSAKPDDGFYERGLAKRYTILTVGQYAGTVNVDCIHLKDKITIAFAATTPGTITDTGNNLAQFKTGDIIVVTGSVSNDGVYTVSTGNVAGTIRTTEATVLEAAGASVSIAKREAISNNCVLDLNTGLMWARYQNTRFGEAASNGRVRWMSATNIVGNIWEILDAYNAANLGGYNDWRICNYMEALSIMDLEAPTGVPDAVAFPGWQFLVWTSTTRPSTITRAIQFNMINGETANDYLKDDVGFQYNTAVVRGG